MDPNPVSQLLEVLQSRGEKVYYTLLGVKGPSHSPTFSMEAQVGIIKTTGYGKNKKEAKRNAAVSMLTKIQSNSNSYVSKEDSDEKQEVKLPSVFLKKIFTSKYEYKNENEESCLLLSPFTNHHSAKMEAFFQLFQSENSQLSSLYHLSCNDDSVDYVKILEEIAKTLKFSLSFSYHDKFRCLTHILDPPLIVVGFGKTQNEAKNESARNILLYLKIITNKDN